MIPRIPEIIDLMNYTSYSKKVSHVGHTRHSGNNAFSLEDQILHKGKFLQGLCDGLYHDLSFLSPNKPIEFVLLGHSIGSYICIKVKKRYPQISVSHIINLFPTVRDLWWGLSPVVKFLTLPGVRHTFSTIVGYTPKMLIEKLFESGVHSSLSKKYQNVVNEKIHYYTVMNVLYMAYTEYTSVYHIDSEIKEVILNNGQDFVWIYGHTDPYTPHHFIDEMKSHFPNTPVYLCSDPSAEHAFCLRYSEPVAQDVYQKLTTLFPERFSH